MNPVLDETGPLALSVPITIVHYGGARTDTRGSMSILAQSEGQLEGQYSESARQAYTATPTDLTRPEYLDVTDPTTSEITRYRVLDHKHLGGAVWGSVDWRTTRYQLLESTEPAVTPPDFDPDDFASDDFATGE